MKREKSQNITALNAIADDLGSERWMQSANCFDTDPDIFFPKMGESIQEAAKLCGECAVKSACLEYAIDNEMDSGIWGGLTAPKRDELQRKRLSKNLDAAAATEAS